jgi:hypothetical protein
VDLVAAKKEEKNKSGKSGNMKSRTFYRGKRISNEDLRFQLLCMLIRTPTMVSASALV